MKNGVTTGEDRMDYLLDVAAELFLKNGFAATSVGEIAAQAKASKSTFYNRFPTKEKLFTEVFRRRADAAFQEFSAILRTDVDAQYVLSSFGESLIRCVLAPDSINLLRLVYMESKHIPELGQIFYRLGTQRGRTETAEYFQKLVVSGYLRSDIDTALASDQFVDLVTGELIRRCALAIDPPITHEEQQYRVRTAVDVFLRAYRA